MHQSLASIVIDVSSLSSTRVLFVGKTFITVEKNEKKKRETKSLPNSVRVQLR